MNKPAAIEHSAPIADASVSSDLRSCLIFRQESAIELSDGMLASRGDADEAAEFPS